MHMYYFCRCNAHVDAAPAGSALVNVRWMTDSRCYNVDPDRAVTEHCCPLRPRSFLGLQLRQLFFSN